NSGYSFYYVSTGYFWREKKTGFFCIAQTVLAENFRSEEAIIYIADYIYNGLQVYNDAIDALAVANGKGLLRIEGQYKLCGYLQAQHRYADSVPILAKMVVAKPERLEFRTMLMKGYFQTNSKDLLAKTLADGDKYFHLDGRWQENVIATFG